MSSRTVIALTAVWAIFMALPAGAAEVEHALSNGATLITDEADEVLTDRASLDEISTQSQGEPDPTLEAYWDSPEFEVYFNHQAVGYVGMDDWDELDVDELWESYLEGSKEQSKLFGFEIRPLRWVVEPTLDRKSAVAYYALEVQFGEQEPLINLVVYDFGRFGYEEMTLVQSSSAFPAAGAGSIATRIASAYQFAPESDYGDFTEGDKIAAMGAGGLVAAAFGAKFGKGILAVALILLKKFWFVLLLVPAALWKFLTGRSKNEAEAEA